MGYKETSGYSIRKWRVSSGAKEEQRNKIVLAKLSRRTKVLAYGMREIYVGVVCASMYFLW